jgi:hypothetical protein
VTNFLVANLFVIPAQAGISAQAAETSRPEIPAFAGMTSLAGVDA